MKLNEFIEGNIFLDSNIFIYSITTTGNFKSCNLLLNKIKSGEITGYINPIVISEVYHKLLILNVSREYETPIHNSIKIIKNNSDVLKKIKGPMNAVLEISKIENIKVLDINEIILESSYLFLDILLINDAIHAATCKYNGIENIATNDSDLERVDFLKVWKP
ncbi:MAG: PIN domain-containing protein [Methanofastidiosum sp.]|jgi:predicted nucleic acid-binding protein